MHHSEDENVIPWRYEKMLCLLLQANALLRDRTIVTKIDVAEIKRVFKHMNFNFNKLEELPSPTYM